MRVQCTAAASSTQRASCVGVAACRAAAWLEEEKEMYYNITAEMILAQPSSHFVTYNPGTLAARV